MTATSTRVPLESGDRLTRDEFHRRYCARPDIKKAEWIDGVVYVASPVSLSHGEPHGSVLGWLYTYKIEKPGLRLIDNVTVFLGDDGEVQPDACLFNERPDGAHVMADNYIEGPPEFVAEIAASSASYDLHVKLRLYERSGVQEYLAWQVYERRIDWFRLHEGRYVRLEPDAHGVIESRVFPGLRLAVEAMLARDDAAVAAALRRAAPDQ